LPLNIFAKELGVAEDELGDIGNAGISSAKAMEAIVRTLEQRFKGGMKEMSNSLLGMTSVIKDTAQLTVWYFGKGMAGPVRRILMDIIGLTDETGGKFEEFQKRLERAGERVGRKFEQVYNRIKRFWSNLSADPEFQKLNFGDKLIYILNLALDKIDAWLSGEGGQRLQETFSKIGGIIAKTWYKGMTNLGERTIQEVKEGDIKGALVPATAMWMLGGGALLRGAWGLGKGIFKAGKWALGKLGLGTAGTAATATTAGTTATTAATASQTVSGISKIASFFKDYKAAYQLAREAGQGSFRSIFEGAKILKETAPIAKASRFGFLKDYKAAYQLAREAGKGPFRSLFEGAKILKETTPVSKASKLLGKVAVPVGIAISAYNVATSEDKWKAVGKEAGGWTGAIAGAKLGAMAGTAIAPGIGTAIGGIIGGIAGAFGGNWLGGKIVDWIHGDIWDEIKQKGTDAWGAIKQKASDAWSWISTNVTFESLARGAGYVYGYLEGTIFNSSWWSSKWESVKTWASNTWSSMVEIWENTKESLSSTLFSSEWWQEKWDNVKSWTSEKWDEMKTVWENAKEALSSTLFSKDWWGSKWENVKTRASGVLNNITTRRGSIKESFRAGREARQAAVAHAVGGILTHPHLGMVAEAGPEAIIPLSARMRPRALELWQQTGELLGVTPHAGGDIFGNVLGGVRNVWDKTRALFKSDRVLSIANTTENAAIALESTRKGHTRTIEEAEKVRAEIMGPSDKRQTIIKEFGSILGAIGTGALVGTGTGMLVGAGVMSPVTAMLGTILGAGAGAFGGRAAVSALYDRVIPYATGGILTRPHLGLVAEAGPEAIIPLSTRMRARALALYEETGRRLGVRPYAEEGFTGALTQNREQKIPVSFTPSFATLGPATINLNFDLTGLVGQVVIENREDIDNAVDKITDAIANNLRAVFQNMTK
jgi:hypothetical protein